MYAIDFAQYLTREWKAVKEVLSETAALILEKSRKLMLANKKASRFRCEMRKMRESPNIFIIP